MENCRLFVHIAVAVTVALNFVELINANCSAPPIILHASNNASTGNNFAEDTQVIYKCENGYIPVDGSYKKFTCYSGSWFNPANFSCKARSCPFLQSPNNGRLSNFDFTFGNVISVECVAGYKLEGFGQLTCQANGEWDGPTLTCTVVECPSLLRPFHGDMTQQHLDGRLNIYNSRVNFQCDYRYRIVGSSTRICQADGFWSGENTACEEIKCLEPVIGFGTIDVEKSIYKLDERIVVSCNTHATLVGNGSILTCGADDTWKPQNVYCFGDCAVVLPAEAASITEIVDGHIKHGTKFHLWCSDGYRPNDLSPIQCNNGNLSRSDLLCNPAPCTSEGVKNTTSSTIRIIHGGTAADEFLPNTLIKVICNNHYGHDEQYNTVECLFGNWDKHLPQCYRWSCDAPKYLPHLSSNATDGQVYDMGAVIFLSCDNFTTHIAQGSPYLTCHKGQWSSKLVYVCKERDLSQKEEPSSLQAFDLVFMLDVSESVSEEEFIMMKYFVKELVSKISIGSKYVQVGLLIYNTETVIEFSLNSYVAKSSLVAAIDNIPYQPGNCNIEKVIYDMRTIMFHKIHGDRFNVQNIVFLITDGHSDIQQTVKFQNGDIDGLKRLSQAEAAWIENGIQIYTIAIDIADKNEIYVIVGKETKTAYFVENFDALEGLEDEIYRDLFPDDADDDSDEESNSNNHEMVDIFTSLGSVIIVLIIVAVVLKKKMKCKSRETTLPTQPEYEEEEKLSINREAVENKIIISPDPENISAV